MQQNNDKSGIISILLFLLVMLLGLLADKVQGGEMKDLLKNFIQYSKQEYGIDIKVVKSETPDTFEKIFGCSFIKEISYENGSYTRKSIEQKSL